MKLHDGSFIRIVRCLPRLCGAEVTVEVWGVQGKVIGGTIDTYRDCTGIWRVSGLTPDMWCSDALAAYLGDDVGDVGAMVCSYMQSGED